MKRLNMKMQYIKCLLSLLLMLPLSACFDTDENDEPVINSSDDQIPRRTGVLVDDVVIGINYKTYGRSNTLHEEGETSSDGEFLYQPGDNIVFSVGAVNFPIVEAAAMLSPMDLAATDNLDDRELINMLRFLQSLDADADSAGITIPASAHAYAVTVDFDVDIDQFETDADVLTYFEGVGLTVSVQDAQTHLMATLDSLELLKTGFLTADFIDASVYDLSVDLTVADDPQVLLSELRFMADAVVRKDAANELGYIEGSYSIAADKESMMVNLEGATDIYVFEYYSPLIKTYAYCRYTQGEGGEEAVDVSDAKSKCSESITNLEQSIATARQMSHYGLMIASLVTLKGVIAAVNTDP